jgi:hypothetical protein
MTDSRRDLLVALNELSEQDPSLRFGQMIANLATHARGAQPESVWETEDEELLVAARRLLEHYRARNTQVA